MMDGISATDVKDLKTPSFDALTINAISKSDGIIMGSPSVNPAIKTHLKKANKPMLEYQSPEDYIASYNAFYDEIMQEDSVLV